VINQNAQRAFEAQRRENALEMSSGKRLHSAAPHACANKGGGSANKRTFRRGEAPEMNCGKTTVTLAFGPICDWGSVLESH